MVEGEAMHDGFCSSSNESPSGSRFTPQTYQELALAMSSFVNIMTRMARSLPQME